MSLNGTTQYLNKTGGFNFNNKNWTVSCWIKKTANGRSDGLFQFGDGTGQGAYVGIYYKSTNAISITFFNDDVDSANTYSDAGNWVHILLTYNYLTKIRRLYRNGIQIINNVSAVIPNTNTNIRIGILGSFYFQGLIDDFRFYDIELNVSQILELYNGRINITYPKLNYGSGAGGGGSS
ncbi:MAG: LamG domain-containing protein [Gemmatimonadaceae bacterium]|nr:LamG domain-containing protein [Gemmatimonadaceae bacterium]